MVEEREEAMDSSYNGPTWFDTSRFLHAFQQSQPVVAGLLLLNETVRDFDVSLVWRGNLQR